MNDNSTFTGSNDDSQNITNEVSDKFTTINDKDVVAETQRTLPRQMQSGSTRGTSWRIDNTDGSYMIIGVNADNNKLGISFYNGDSNITRQVTGNTDYFYDPDKRVSIAIGYPPGFTTPILVIAKEGKDAIESISS